MRPHGRPKAVVRSLHVGYPVAQSLADRVLQRAGSTVNRAHFCAQGLHAEYVGGLAGNVLDAHVDDAGNLQERAGCGRGHAVHAGAGLGDDPTLPQSPRQQDLAQGVVQLVGAGVVEILALEVEPDTIG